MITKREEKIEELELRLEILKSYLKDGITAISKAEKAIDYVQNLLDKDKE